MLFPKGNCTTDDRQDPQRLLRGAEEGAEALLAGQAEAEGQETVSEGNVLFLVCTPCSQNPAESDGDYGVKLAQRSRVGFYDPMVPPQDFAKWLIKHAKCAGRGNSDHFQLAYLCAQNHDQQTVKEAVKLALVT